MKAKKQLLGFTAASLTLGAVFMAGGAPIPFYHTYAETLGLDKGVLSLATVAYFAGTVIALLFLPRLTNYWGRKRAIYLTLAFGLAGCFYRQHGRNCGRHKPAGKGGRIIFNLRCCLWRRGAAKPSGKPHCPVFFAAGAYRRLRCFYGRNVYFGAAYRKAQLLL